MPAKTDGVAEGGMSCTSPAHCVAAVAPSLTDGASVPLIDTWNGRTWSARKLPIATSIPQQPQFSDVSCLTAKHCVAVGTFLVASTTPWKTVAAFFNGKKWTHKPLPGRGVDLGAISCASARSCLAVGSRGGDAYGEGARLYAESWIDMAAVRAGQKRFWLLLARPFAQSTRA